MRPDANLPVLVWIHGGGCAPVSPNDEITSDTNDSYIAGAASSFSGEDIIKESGYGVITVIIQYRLGVFGFLPGSEVLANGTLNAGLRECRSLVRSTSLLKFLAQLIKTSHCNGSRSM